jgi:hypothetical protein
MRSLSLPLSQRSVRKNARLSKGYWEIGRGEGDTHFNKGRRQLRANPGQHKIAIIRDFRVCEAHNVEAEPFEPLDIYRCSQSGVSTDQVFIVSLSLGQREA